MIKVVNKYRLTILGAAFLIQSIIVDYSNNKDDFTWIGTMLYKVYSTFGVLPINAFYLIVTIIFYRSERYAIVEDSENKKTNNGFKTFGYLLIILLLVYHTINNV